MSQWATIRRKAAELLEEYERKSQELDLPPAFSPTAGPHAVLHHIARECLRLSVISDDALPRRVWGSINREEDTISINPSVKGSKKSFVTAHEIGHGTLGHPARPFLENGTNPSASPFLFWDGAEDIDEEPNAAALLAADGGLRRYSTRANVELQANVFAAELLAPVGKLREWIETRGNCDLAEMTAYFGVSKSTLKNQLMATVCGAAHSEIDDKRALPALDEDQHRAAIATGATLVVAGPGAGKTRVLTARFEHLVNQKAVEPDKILVLTYSHKAAEEMRARLSAVKPSINHEINVGTFHALGQQLLLDFWREAGFSGEPELLTDADAFVLLRSRIGDLPLDNYADILEPTRNLGSLLDAIARLKDELIGPEEFRQQVEDWASKVSSSQNVRKARELAAVYECYQSWLRAENYVDYGDLILESVRLFDDDLVAWTLRDRFQHVLVDEFQDINCASGRLMQQLDGGRGIVWAVADPRQSIYAFRGATRANVENFITDYANSQILELSTNYRSVEDIVCAGNAVNFGTNSQEHDSLHPELSSHLPRAQTPAVTMALAPNAASEIAGVVRTVQELKQTGYLPRQIAVLCRRRDMAQSISLALEAAGISSDWSGAMHEQDAFKDMMAVLLLACNHPHALPRLLCHPAHALCQADTELVLSTLRAKGGSPRATLRAFDKGEVEGLTQAGLITLRRLRGVSVRAARRPSAFNILSAYLWEETEWFLARCQDPSPQARRYVATVGQVVDFAREFSGKGAISAKASPSDFVDYVRSCLETRKLKTAHDQVSIPEAVTIMTVHGSKGLEWPVVIVPGCVQMKPPFSSIVYPPNLTRAFSSGNDAHSRACLAYVAVTRAREKLVLSRVENESLPEMAFAEVVSTLDSESLVNHQKWPDVMTEMATKAPSDKILKPTEDNTTVLDLNVLELLQFCGKKAKYTHVDGLRAESSGYLLFRRVLNETFEWMVGEHNITGVPTRDSVNEYLAQRWEIAEPHQRQLEQFYRAHTTDYAQIFADRLARSRKLRWKLNFENERAIPGVVLQFQADECEQGDNNRRPILRWHCFNAKLPSADKLKTHLRLALYSRRLIGGSAPEIRVYHVPTGQETSVAFRDEHWQAAQAELHRLYALWGHKELTPDISFKCFSCAFNFLCPS